MGAVTLRKRNLDSRDVRIRIPSLSNSSHMLIKIHIQRFNKKVEGSVRYMNVGSIYRGT
jgi:hypothetical protein